MTEVLMKRNIAYILKFYVRSMFISFSTRTLLIQLIILFISLNLTAQEEYPEYDEIPVYMEVRGVGGMEIPALIKGEELFLSVTDLFDFLRIRNNPNAGLDSISGFFINPESQFYINRSTNRISYQNNVHLLKSGDLVRTETGLYLKTQLFGSIFGLDCIFNFRNLTVLVTSNIELPVMREMKQEELRKNLRRLKGEIKADTTIGLSRPGFRFGMADWSVVSTQEIDKVSDARLNLSLGAMIAGGDATANLTYDTRVPFSEKQQHYLWRYVDNDFAPIRQISVGKINTQATSTIYNPVVGVQLTNTPTSFRRSFGTYTLSDKSEPGWVVELYVNNVLVDYVTADASGFFTFQVPLVYGNTMVKLKHYGPWGEERINEQNINIPYNFIPEKTLEYSVNAGIVEDTLFSKYGKATVNYGLSRSITIGAGMEYLSSVTSGPVMPFVKASFRVAGNILLNTEYTYGVRARGTLTYRLPSNLQFDLNYIRYKKGQTAISFNYVEDRKISASLPVRIGSFSSFNRISVNQLVLPTSLYTTAEWLFSGNIGGVNTNLTTYSLMVPNAKPYIYSNLSLSLRLPARITVMPQAQYAYTTNKLMSVKVRAEKMIGERAFANISAERILMSNMTLAEAGFRYDFNFARTGATIRQAGKTTSFIENASGSLISDRRTRFLKADNRQNVGRGGVTIIPYLDLNGNGMRDKGEQKIAGLGVHTNGGRIIENESDTTIRIFGLEPYTESFVELNENNFESIAWKLPKKIYSIMIEPNILKEIDVPVTILGEASGSVSLKKDGTEAGIGRIIMIFMNSDGKRIARSLSENDGYYSYFGLNPGRYNVLPDTSQLRILGMTSNPVSKEFTVKADLDGDYITDLDFVLSEVEKVIPELKPDQLKDSITKTDVVVPKPVTRKDTVIMLIHEVSQELVTISEDCYAIQLGAFRLKSNADNYKRQLEKQLGRKVDIIIEGDLYKVRINDLKDRKEVDEVIAVLKKFGVTELWLISLKAKQQQWVLVERQDTVREVRDIIEGAEEPVTTGRAIQVGAFKNESNALALKERLGLLIDKPAVIIKDGGYYKVQVRGMKDMAEIEKVISSLGIIGLHDIWVPPSRQPEPVKPPEDSLKIPVIVPADAVSEPVVTPDTLKMVTSEPVIVPEPEVAVPKVSMHVAAYFRKGQAVRAKKKIEKKLGLPVEISQQWDYFHVVVTGFFTREETFRYYPELAGIGFPNISIIDKNEQ